MKKIFVLVISLLLVCAFNSNIFADSDSAIPEEVFTVANDGVELVKSKMMSDPGRWGFTSVNEINRLILGEGFQVNYIDGYKLSTSSGKSITELIAANIIDTWEFTLDMDGISKVFLTVAFEDGAYRVVHFGGNAEQFGIARKNFESLTNDKGLTVKPTLISIGSTYYWATLINDEEFALPVITNNDSSKIISNNLQPASVIIEILKDIQKNIKSGERGTYF